jgi:tRNA (mo5U34)-methyltransferase
VRGHDDLERAVASTALWYHTIDLAPGVTTPGRFDLRPVTAKLPWPDLTGKRCLDIGTYDGFFAFEMERRGASEVVATDIASHEDWDWPPSQAAAGPGRLAESAGAKGGGFAVAADALGSSVTKREINVYDLSPDSVGTFDFVFCGSLLLHLRDPFRALAAIRSVCRDLFLSNEQIDPVLTVLRPRTPLARINGIRVAQWQVPNLAGFRQMIRAAGFEVVAKTRPFSVPFGPAHPRARKRPSITSLAVRTIVAGGDGVPHAAVLARVGRF